MTDKPTLKRTLDLPTAGNWEALREEGLAHIQKLSGLIWTDHNTHDPGITTLEILSYALTDLAYRTNFDTADLLTGPDGSMDSPARSGLFPAHEVLTTAPRTVADYRRLLLRIEGVRNAWLDPMQDPTVPDNFRQSEVPVYADLLAGSLDYSATNAAAEDNVRLHLSGLYKVLLELEIDDQLGSLNDAALDYRVKRGTLKGMVLRLDSRDVELLAGDFDFSGAVQQVSSVSVSRDDGFFTAKLRLDLDDERGVGLQQLRILVLEDRPDFRSEALELTAAKLRAVLTDALPDGLLPLFWLKQQRRARTVSAVRRVLHAHRGLCEDFLSVATVASHRVALCADIEVDSAADLEEVQARVYREVEKYFSPPVTYHTLEEMLASGRAPDEIFNSPYINFDFQLDGEKVFTKPGFVTAEALRNSELRRRAQASDIINIVVDIEGVEAIRNLQLRVYDDDGVATGESLAWSLDIPPGRQPVFYMEGSKLIFHRAGIPYRAQLTEFRRTLDHLRALDRREVYVAPDQVLPAPSGRWRNVDEVYSVQHDFPANYLIGEAGISRAETPARIARARQFKGYLTLFDQLLADYLGQLANLRRLYSLDKTLVQSWFSPYLNGLAGSLETFEDEFYVDKQALADDLLRARLNESEAQFLERRNRLLDHLVARFAERFADYAFMSYRLAGDRARSAAEAIEDKIDFLSDYARLSRGRGQAANLCPEKLSETWDSENISGLERRVGRLLGLPDLRRRDLHCRGHFAELFSSVKRGDQFRVAIREGRQNLFISADAFANRAAAKQAAARFYQTLRLPTGLDVREDAGAGTWRLSLVAGSRRLVHETAFDEEIDAVRAARSIVDRYDDLLASPLCDSTGMHLLEHILLRPRATGDPLLNVCLQAGCDTCGDEDPYSFRATVVLPYWPEDFRNPHFRALVERTLREEAPAHVQLKICWIDQRQMQAFDKAYRAWLKLLAAESPGAEQWRETSARLIEVLDSLRSVYPETELHDCDVGEGDSPVLLGSSALGIY